jgi:hypothetical protein
MIGLRLTRSSLTLLVTRAEHLDQLGQVVEIEQQDRSSSADVRMEMVMAVLLSMLVLPLEYSGTTRKRYWLASGVWLKELHQYNVGQVHREKMLM